MFEQFYYSNSKFNFEEKRNNVKVAQLLDVMAKVVSMRPPLNV